MKNEKDGRLATGGPWYNMFSWSLFHILSTHLYILLVFPRPFCCETSHGSCGWGSSDSVRCVYSFHRKVEVRQMVLAGFYNYYYRSIALDLPRFKLLFRYIA